MTPDIKNHASYLSLSPLLQDDHHGHRASHLSGAGSAARHQVHLLWAGWNGVHAVPEEPHHHVSVGPDAASANGGLLQDGAVRPATPGSHSARGGPRRCQQGTHGCVSGFHFDSNFCRKKQQKKYSISVLGRGYKRCTRKLLSGITEGVDVVQSGETSGWRDTVQL